MPETVLTLLKKDHQLVKGLFSELEKLEVTELSRRETIFKHIKSELEIHSKVEEALLYKRLKPLDQTHMPILEATEEHNLLEKLLLDLNCGPMNTEEWCAKLTVMKENFLHHVEEEESELFPLAKKLLSRAELMELGEQLKLQKEKLKDTVMAMA